MDLLNKITRVIVLVALFACVLPACESVKALLPAKVTDASGQDQKQNAAKTANQGVKIDKGTDDLIKKMITEYFKKLYSASPEIYFANNTSGVIPDRIKSFISKRTLAEGDGNPDNGIHLPRILEINGQCLYNYGILTYSLPDNKDIPEIDANFITNNNGVYTYFVKVALKAKTTDKEKLAAAYTEDSETHSFTANGSISDADADFMNIQARYDLEIVKEEDQYKIMTAKEANSRYGYKNRIFRLNTDFVTKLPYLFAKGIVSNEVHANEEDTKTYTDEKQLIEAFFQSMTSINNNRMELMKNNWIKGQSDFQSFIRKMDIKLGEKFKDKTLADIMDISTSYQEDFDLSYFPLQIRMKKISEVKNLVVLPHPKYSEKIKSYIVKFEANIEKENGIVDNNNLYKYDYFVDLSGSGDSLKVKRIRLNEYYTLPAPAPAPAPTQNPANDAQKSKDQSQGETKK